MKLELSNFLPCKLRPGMLQGSSENYQVWSLATRECDQKICWVAFFCFLHQCKQHRIISVKVSLETLTLWIPLILKEMWMTTLNELLVQTVDPLLSWALFKQKWTMPFKQSLLIFQIILTELLSRKICFIIKCNLPEYLKLWCWTDSKESTWQNDMSKW